MSVHEAAYRRERPNTKFQTLPELQFEILNIPGVSSDKAYENPGSEKVVAAIELGGSRAMSSTIASRDRSMHQRLERVIAVPDKLYGLVKVYDEQGERYVLTSFAHDNEEAALAVAMKPGEMIALSEADATTDEGMASWRTRLYLSPDSSHMFVEHVGMGEAVITGATDYGVENVSPITPEVWAAQFDELQRHSFGPATGSAAA